MPRHGLPDSPFAGAGRTNVVAPVQATVSHHHQTIIFAPDKPVHRLPRTRSMLDGRILHNTESVMNWAANRFAHCAACVRFQIISLRKNWSKNRI